MREADRRTIETVGIPSRVLMENAGRAVVSAMADAFDDLPSRHVAVVCGRGNNGGDGFVIARVLAAMGVRVTVLLIGRASEVAGDARANLDLLGRVGLSATEVADVAVWTRHASVLRDVDIVVDALFGTGLARPLEGLAATVVTSINEAARPVVAVDLPSGLSADTAEIQGPAIRATLTVTFAAPKISHLLLPAEALCGRLVIADIGIPAAVIDGLDGFAVEWLTAASMRSLIKPRKPDSQKGDFGRILIVAGSTGKTGAAALSARAALRAGAGLVTVATPASCQPIVAALGAEYMTEALAEDADGTVAAGAIDRVLSLDADVIAAGPGLGRSPGVIAFVRALVQRARVSLVLDADALFAIADDPSVLDARESTEIVITPHPGEMSRLTGKSIADVQARRMGLSVEFAAAHRVTVLLKGHRTVIASPNGGLALNSTGNPGMATAGAGDVLTGMLAGWYGQLRNLDQAVRLAVYLHGLAGDHAEAAAGESALIAGDLIDHLGGAVRTLTGAQPRRLIAP